MNPFPGLIRLLEHSDNKIASDAIILIFLFLEVGCKTTSNTEQHPHYESIQTCHGIQKIFTLFQKNGSKYCKDRAAICLGYLFKAHLIADPIMRHEIICHLKILLNDSDDWLKGQTKNALKYLAKNDNIQLRRDSINVGIIEALLRIFASRNLDYISLSYTSVFLAFTYPSNFDIYQLLIEKQPFPPLLRLFNHKDENVVSNTVAAICNILYYSALESELNQQHPFFAVLASAGGIEKIHSLFKKTKNQFSKKSSSICLGIVLRAQEIKDSNMRKEVIVHLKSIINDPQKNLNKLVQYALKCLAQNIVNRNEIEGDGFSIPE
ncbi:MAG: hypothetical protein EZS28_024349 [Streblomastix strix]|uniref:Uncharacterized protein n=1 Tax=Streblomastix strix TaxID=222440 RepID=A0A5J4VCN8_9EUKA|nr:MAG: hypothetical protein EZS28_024349 [Streblomastix strix]